MILGRPFLATGKPLIDVDEGKLRVQDESITFQVLHEVKSSVEIKSCFVVNEVRSFLHDAIMNSHADNIGES